MFASSALLVNTLVDQKKSRKEQSESKCVWFVPPGAAALDFDPNRLGAIWLNRV